MKKLLILITLVSLNKPSSAQNTYPFPSTGRIGIGTTSPEAPLHIANGIVTAGESRIFKVLELSPSSGIASFGNGSAQFFDSRTNQGNQSVAGIWSSLYSGGNGSNYYSGSLVFATKNDTDLNVTERMRIMMNGKVGIGTSSPSETLTVAGNIGAREIKVMTTAGADFVFEEDYRLASLKQLEKFIIVNKHLPNINSASEMVKKGIDLGEFSIQLLQKIEELTLHLIRQQKELDTIKKRFINSNSSNQIATVSDQSGSIMDFNDGANSAIEYTYDGNGNITSDTIKSQMINFNDLTR